MELIGNDETAAILLETKRDVSPTGAAEYLRNKSPDSSTSLPPMNAAGGTVYLYFNPEKSGEYKGSILHNYDTYLPNCNRKSTCTMLY